MGLGYIWPMAVIVRAATSDDENEIVAALDTLKRSALSTGFIVRS